MRFASWLLGLLLSAPLQADWHRAEWDSMGTRASVEFFHAGHGADAIVTALQEEFQRLESLLSPWISDSELARFNTLDANERLTISPELETLLRRSRHYWEASAGAFDVTFAGAGHLYDYRAGVAPDAETLSATVINMSLIGLDARQAWKKDARVRIDLGGIAKGYAIDQAVTLLQQRGVEHAWVSLGGDSYVLGQRGDRPWTIGIRHPRDRDAVALSLPLSNVAVSTSGDYQRYFVRDGEWIHHILDPQTGRSANQLVSVTVVADRSIDADALSTALFVLGVDAGLALANRLPGISAVIIDRHGKVHYSADLSPPSAARP